MKTNALNLFGISIYNRFIEAINNELSGKDSIIDMRHYHFLCEHKHIIKDAILYMNKYGYILNGDYFYHAFDNLENSCLILRNRILKYRINNNNNILKDVKTGLENIIEQEKKLFKELADNILLNKNISITLPKENVFNYDNINITYSSGWMKSSTSENMRAFDKGAYAIIVFYGNSIRYYAERDKDCGIIDVYIDGIKLSSIDLFSPLVQDKCLIYENIELSDGYHVVKIENSGNKNGESSGYCISLNMIAYGNVKSKENATYRSSVEIKNVDKSTKGNWPGIYGDKGFNIFDRQNKLEPHHVKYIIDSYPFYEFKGTSWNDKIIFEHYESMLCIDKIKEIRKAFFAYPETFDVKMIIFDGIVSFFLHNWNHLIHGHEDSIKVECWDDENGELLDSRTINFDEGYADGMYLTYRVKGHVRFSFSNPEPNRSIYIQGVFWD